MATVVSSHPLQSRLLTQNRVETSGGVHHTRSIQLPTRWKSTVPRRLRSEFMISASRSCLFAPLVPVRKRGSVVCSSDEPRRASAVNTQSTSMPFLNHEMGGLSDGETGPDWDQKEAWDSKISEEKPKMFKNRFLGFVRIGSVINNAAESFFKSEIRRRLFVTAALLVVSRIGYYIPLPGFDRRLIPQNYLSFTSGSVEELGELDTELKLSLFQLGISPQIGASIIMQVLCYVVPYLVKLRKEGLNGHEKIKNFSLLLLFRIRCRFLWCYRRPWTIRAPGFKEGPGFTSDVSGGNLLKQSNFSTNRSLNSEDASSVVNAKRPRVSVGVNEETKNAEIFQAFIESFLRAFRGKDLIIGNVGDSRVVLDTRDKDGTLIAVELTVDLKPNIPGADVFSYLSDFTADGLR